MHHNLVKNLLLKFPIALLLIFNSSHVAADTNSDRLAIFHQYCNNRKASVALSIMYFFGEKMSINEVDEKIISTLNQKKIDDKEQDLILDDVNVHLKSMQRRIDAGDSRIALAYDQPMDFAKIVSDSDYQKCLEMISRIR